MEAALRYLRLVDPNGEANISATEEGQEFASASNTKRI